MKKYKQHWREWNDEKQRECNRRSYHKHKETRRIKIKKWQLDLKVEVFSMYCGGKPICTCCKEDMLEFLALDHIGGGGLKKRKARGNSYTYYTWLRKNNFPDGYRILCHNCNQATSWGRKCPHELLKEANHAK